MPDFENVSIKISEGEFLFEGHHYCHPGLREHEGQFFHVQFVRDDNGMLCGNVSGVYFVLYPVREVEVKMSPTTDIYTRSAVISAISKMLVGFCRNEPYNQERGLADKTEAAMRLRLPHCHVRVELRLIKVRT